MEFLGFINSKFVALELHAYIRQYVQFQVLCYYFTKKEIFEFILYLFFQYKQLRPNTIQQKNCEAETLRVFRLITSQVFGRLLEQPPEVASTSTSEDQQEPYLKEHVVGILFSRSKLSHLQKQVCSHIGKHKIFIFQNKIHEILRCF